jgi:uncharacterized protein YbbK (DUF523 family)
MTYWDSELFLNPDTASSRPLVASSACLLGEAVRYDGGHKYQANIETLLSSQLQLEAVCPEVGIGMGVPRPTLEGISTSEGVRIVLSADYSVDLTPALTDYGQQYSSKCGPFWPICAWIFKARSPSCAVASLPVDKHLNEKKTADGAFAASIAADLPWLLRVDEEELQNREGCEDLLLLSFICRDIVWRLPQSPLEELTSHYGELLGSLDRHSNALDLWREVCEQLRRDNEKRRELIAQFRAA